MNRLIKYSLLGSMLLTHIVDAKNIATPAHAGSHAPCPAR